MRISAALLVASAFLVASWVCAFSATPLRPFKAHQWQVVLLDGLPSAQAFSCNECQPDLILRCVAAGRGLIELRLAGATVSNGRGGATKQIGFSFGSDRLQRRAVTQRLSRGYTPVVELGFDDDLLEHLSESQLLKISFYGQRSYVGLRDASGPIGQVVEACRPRGFRDGTQYCVWAAVIICSSDRVEAEAVRQDISASFIRVTADGYCAVLASEALATAKARVSRFGGHLERSCLPSAQ